MIFRHALLLLATILHVSAQVPQVASKEFLPGRLWPDNLGCPINAHGGGLLQYRGTNYWFGEHKIAGVAGNSAHVGVHVYSSLDLYNWNDEGIALRVSLDTNSPIHEGCILERPKVIYNPKTRKFVMWFHLEPNNKDYPMYSGAFAGVAVADAPTGPYKFLQAGRLNAKTLPVVRAADGTLSFSARNELNNAKIFFRDFDKGQMARDCTIFMDDNGKAYLITASEDNRCLHFIQLTDDFTQPDGTFTRFQADRFTTNNEAPAIFKKDGKYFLMASDCTGWDPNAARMFTADSIWGPWKYLGNPCRGTESQNKITFESQSTYFLPVSGKPGQFIYMGDRWRPQDAIDGRYVWLPVQFDQGLPVLEWKDKWSLAAFDSNQTLKPAPHR